jgi:hypothetical protein
VSVARKIDRKWPAPRARASPTDLSFQPRLNAEPARVDERMPSRSGLCRIDRMTARGRHPIEAREPTPS